MTYCKRSFIALTRRKLGLEESYNPLKRTVEFRSPSTVCTNTHLNVYQAIRIEESCREEESRYHCPPLALSGRLT